MTDLYVVLMKTNLNYRWVDSYWLAKEAALKRCESVKLNLHGAGQEVRADGWWVWMVRGSIEDAALVKDKTLPAPEKPHEPAI